jgi:hypothetical protein
MVQTLWKKLTKKAVSMGICSDCTRFLDQQKEREPLNTETEVVHCGCGRVYLYDRLHRQYTRYRENKPRTYGS